MNKLCEELSEWCEEKSKENMAYFYLDELSYIARTHKKPPLKQRELFSLYKNGLIIYDFVGFGIIARYNLTPFCLSIIEKMDGQKMTTNSPIGHNEIAPVGLPVPGSEMSLITLKEGKSNDV